MAPPERYLALPKPDNDKLVYTRVQHLLDDPAGLGTSAGERLDRVVDDAWRPERRARALIVVRRPRGQGNWVIRAPRN